MKTVVLPLIICLLCLFQPLQAQQNCSSAGLSTFSLTYMPTTEPLYARFATQVIQLADGDYVTIGLTRKEDSGNPNRYRMFWARFSQDGDLNAAPQQISIFDLIELDFYYDGFHSPMHLIEACSENGECEGYYVLATVFSDPEIGGDDTDVILMRLDKEGCLLWVEHFLQFEPENEFARGLFPLENGLLACFIQHADAGQNFSNLSVVLATPGNPGCEVSFEYIIAADPPFLFESLTVTDVRDMPNPDARFAIAGRVRNIDGNPWLGVLMLDQSFEVIDGFIPLYDLDAQPFTAENPRDIEQDKEFLVITGTKQDFDPTIPSGLNETGFLMKVEPFDNGGNTVHNLIWANEYDLPNMFDDLESDRFRSVEVTEDGYAIGGSSIAPGFQGLALLMGTDKEGAPRWINRYLEPNLRLSGLDDLKIVADGGFLMGGTRWAPPGNGENGIWLAKTDREGRYPNCNCFMEAEVEVTPLSPEQTGNDVVREIIDCEPDTWQWLCQEWDDVLVYCDQGPPPCMALFQAAPLDECGTYQFTNLSTGPGLHTYLWDFGDFSNSNAVNPTHHFDPGVYQVCLTLATSLNCTDIYCETITVDYDTVPPTIICPDDYVIYTDPDACENTTFEVPPLEVIVPPCAEENDLNCSQLSGPWPLGTTVVVCVASNEYGSNTCSFNVTVLDTIPPTIICPPDTCVFVGPNINGTNVTYDAPFADDNCPFNVSCSPASGSFFPIGTTTVTCTATDNSGNSSTCTFDVIVKPEEVPECWEVDNLRVECDTANFYKYNASFRLRHFGNFLADEALLYNLPAGFHFVHSNGDELQWISLDIAPPVPAGVYSTPLPFMIVSDNPISVPTEVCFSISPSGLNEDGLWECCFSDSTLCVILEPCCDPCEEVSLTIDEVSKDSCCFSMNLDNLCPLANFSSIETEILTPGVTYGSHAFGGPTAANWNNPIVLPQRIRWAHNSGSIPVGSFPSLINFCLDNITTDAQIPQTVLVRYIETLPTGLEIVACTDTLIFQCPKTDFPCVELEDYAITCTDMVGTYDFDFNFINASDHIAHFLDISVVAPVGVTVVPDGVLIPAGLNPGDVGTGSVQIQGGTPGGSVILQMRLEDLFSGDGWCCIESDTFEIELPFCETTCPPCENNLLRNAGFENPDPFPAAEWIRPFETGSTPGVTNNAWCSGDWSVIMQSNTEVPEIMAQELNPAIRLGRTYSLRFCAMTSDPGVQFHFRASNNLPTDFSCIGSDCAVIGDSPTINPDGEWACYEVPFWTSPNDFEYFVFNINPSPDGVSTVGFIDDICLVETGNAGGSSLQANFFPNPTTDLVNITVDLVPQDDLTAVITDLYGKPLRTKVLSKGTKHWQLDTASLPAGVYLVSLKSGGEILSTERIVKQ